MAKPARDETVTARLGLGLGSRANRVLPRDCREAVSRGGRHLHVGH